MSLFPETNSFPPLSYARVALNRPLAQAYTYFIPESMGESVRVGSIVEVPLRTEKVAGTVMELIDKPDTRVRIKPIGRVLTPEYHLNAVSLRLAEWIAGYYRCAPGEACATVSMIGFQDVKIPTQLNVALADLAQWVAAIPDKDAEERRITAKHRKVVEYLIEIGNRAAPPAHVSEATGVGRGVIDTMRKRGYLADVFQVAEIDPLPLTDEPATPPEFTADQHAAFETLLEAVESKTFKPFLLHGITGSGKTEIYLRLIEDCLDRGGGAIVLVPEISLTPQTVNNFRRRLGHLVGVYHSRLNATEKLQLWQRIEARDVRVVIGARSALFAPVPDLAVIVVDEEHESSYKQAETPRYHARDSAVMRGKFENALVVLGSATPSIESLNNAREGKYRLLELPHRVGPHAPPVMTVVDMRRLIRDQPIDGIDSTILSPTLREAIAKRLAAREQTVLLLNRRGFASQVVAMASGDVMRCPNCDVALTYHKTIDKLLCHWCGHRMAIPPHDAQGSPIEYAHLGLGTQRVEELLAATFPKARTMRVDNDSMNRKHSFEEAWRKIESHEVDIILGTQMIAKGLHLENITLVGVIAADFALYLPDFRAPERTFSLLTQVAGRAGRGAKPGEVILQTYMPDHYAIATAARMESGKFYERELKVRRLLRFPPFARLIAVLVSSEKEALAREQAQRLAGILKATCSREVYRNIQVMGPTIAPISRLKTQYRWRLLLRGTKQKLLHQLVDEGMENYQKTGGASGVTIVADVDPLDFM